MKAEIDVDLLNPGQVFACLGLLEGADELCGGAEGGFDWDDSNFARFMLKSVGDENPVETVLGFLAAAKIEGLRPKDYGQLKSGPSSEAFPASKEDDKTLPVLLNSGNQKIVLEHWADGSSCESFKLFTGNRSAEKIMGNMIGAIRVLWERDKGDLVRRPFDLCEGMKGSFNFDPRGAWTAMDAGYSLNDSGYKVEASPVVEVLAAWGLQNARPDWQRGGSRVVTYGVWKGLLPLPLARPVLGGGDVGVPARTFKFELGSAGKNKIVQFATRSYD